MLNNCRLWVLDIVYLQKFNIFPKFPISLLILDVEMKKE